MSSAHYTSGADDCCPGEPVHGDPRGLHTHDCPVYLANMAALDRWRQHRVDHPPPVDEQAPPGAVLASWDAWQCQDCGSRYGQRYDQHGAPQPCGGVLVAVTVTITRRAA